MKEANYHKAITLLFILFTSLHSLFGNDEQKRILAIFSYEADNYSFTESAKILKQEFPDEDYLIDFEFLESKRYLKNKLFPAVYERIKTKQQLQNKYDLVISGNDNALLFCIEYQQQLFAETPIVFWGVNDIEKALEQDNNKWITGQYTKTQFKERIEFIQKLHKDNDGFVVVYDNTTTGLADYKTLSEDLKTTTNFQYELLEINNLSISEIHDYLKNVSSKKIILILSALRTKEGYIKLEKLNSLLNKYTNKIIYNNLRYFPDNKYTGGSASNNKTLISQASKTSKKILNGVSPELLKVEPIYNTSYYLNYQRLLETNVNLREVPEQDILVNLPLQKLQVSKRTFYYSIALVLTILVALTLLLFIINSRRKYEKALRINSENYTSIFKENHSIMLIIDPRTSKIVDANNTACRFYGYNLNEMKGMRVREVTDLPEQNIEGIFKQIMNRNLQTNIKHKLKGGEIRDVEVHAGKIEINNKIYFYAIVHDITSRMKAQQELIEAREKAEESDRLKSAFLANMSHEIRTPMNSILGFSSLLAEDELDFATKALYFDYMQTNGEHLLKLINDIIDISKIEANQISIKIRDCKINNLLDEIDTLYENQLKKEKNKDIQLILTKGISNEDFSIKTDETRLKQVILNLLSNAFKFTDSGKIEFGYKFRDDSMLQFYVKDTGIGIPEEKQKDIFTVFGQVEDTATRSNGGTGLGLSISKSLVEKLGGHIWVVSELGKGSRFYFTISATSNLLNLN